MIIKYLPEDFYVKEIIKFPERDTKFTYFLMWKKNLTTIRAIKIIAKHFHVSKKRISFAGEKDKRAITEQYISIGNLNDIEESIDLGNVKLNYIGTFAEPVSLKLLLGNFFKITIRDLDSNDLSKFKDSIKRIKNYGFINYYDEQRFGDIRCNNHLIGKAIVKRDYEKAVKILLTFYSEKENKTAREARLYAKENWGDWKSIIKKFPRWLDIELAILNHLINFPNDFKGALLKLHKKLLKLFVNAYQSYLFNKALSEYIKQISNDYSTISLTFGEIAIPKDETTLKSLMNEDFPIIGYDTDINKLPENIREIYNAILNKEGISLKEFKFYEKHMRFLSSSGDTRKILVKPENIKFNFDRDEIFHEKFKLILEFYLPKGVYATILVKQLFDKDTLSV